MSDNLMGLFGFIFKHKISLILAIILFVLIKQNFYENNFPYIILKKQNTIAEIQKNNLTLQKNNILLLNKISNYTKEDMSLIESKARYKYGLVKEGEIFFKVNRFINTDNIDDSSNSTL